MNAIAELTIFPLDKGESLSTYVAEVIKIIKNSGLDFHTNPMGTCLEGEWSEVMKTVNLCMEQMKENSNRVYMVLKVDVRGEESGRMEKKIRSLQEKIH